MGGRRAATTLVAALLVLLAPVLTHALELTVPGEAVLLHEEENPADTHFVPIGPFADGHLPSLEIEGRVTRQAWRIEGADLTTLMLIAPLREQLRAAGYEILLDCVNDECGGFDFRARIDVLPAPLMFVNLFDFRFLSARRRAQGDTDYITVLASVVSEAGYVQLVVVGTNTAIRLHEDIETAARPVTAPAPVEARPGLDSLIERLQAEGHVVLGDLVFATGSSALEDRDYASLKELARYLKADPERRIALVGHTDAVGTLENNIALSLRRAEAVLERLAERHGVPRGQMEAHGVGYLAPVASNATPQGRKDNRRVEAVLLNGG